MNFKNKFLITFFSTMFIVGVSNADSVVDTCCKTGGNGGTGSAGSTCLTASKC